MGTPLDNYKEVDLGARKDPDLKRSPEKYFWGAMYFAAIIMIGAAFRVPPTMPYRGLVQAILMLAFLGIIVTTLVRRFSKSH